MKASRKRLDSATVQSRRQGSDSSAMRVAAAAAALGAAAAELNAAGRITAWSAEAQRLLGWRREQAVGLSLAELLGDDADPLRAGALLALAQSRGALLTLRRVDGSPLRCHVHLSARAGRVRGFDLLFRPAAAAVREAETFRSFFDSASIGILVLSTDGIVLDGNTSALSLFGCTRGTLVGSAFEAISGARTPAHGGLQAAIARALTGGSTRLGCRIRTADGRLLTVELTLAPGSYFGLPSVLLFTQDVTRLHSARAELGLVRERMRALLQASPVPTLSVDAEGQVTGWNPAAERTFGWSADEVLGRQLPWAEGDGEAVDVWLPRALAGETLAEVRAVARHKEGAQLRVSVSSTPIHDGSGAVAGSIALLAELGEPPQRDELERAARLNALGALASRVMHDFNNILTVVEGDAELLALELRQHGAELPEELTDIRDAAARAGELTRQLLAFGRGDKAERRVLNLNHSVQNLGRMLRRLVGADVEFTVVAEAEQPYVMAVPGELDQVLVNLVVNARDAMESGGCLTVQTLNVPGRAGPRAPGEPEFWAALRVSDTGRGIPPDVMGRIFDPFFTTRAAKGSGLGLWTVDRVVREAGGHVRVRSAPGEGTEVTVLLPMASPELRPAPSLGLPSGLESGEPRSSPCLVLVVEDDPVLRRVMRQALERAGFETVVAGNGEEGLREWERLEGGLGLVISDVVMPLMGGKELVARMRAIQPDLPVLLVSGYDDVGAALGQPGVALLHKPFGAGELIRAVQRALAAPPGRIALPGLVSPPDTEEAADGT